jgi:lathosterol oxidase
MDVVLELTDTFIADHAYAWLFPLQPAPYDFPKATAANASAAYSSWTYKPATKYFQVQPYPAAYLSSLPRDNVWRQAVTLFLITWYVPLLCLCSALDLDLRTRSPDCSSAPLSTHIHTAPSW